MKRIIISIITILLLVQSIGVFAQSASEPTTAQSNPTEPTIPPIEQSASAEDVAEPMAADALLDTPDMLWQRAATAYNEGRYSQAAADYAAIAAQGLESAALYYNLANAYFKSEELGLSILYYNRALRLAPSDEDVRHNLAYAEQSTKDSIEQIPEFFLTTWVRSLRSLMSGNAWTVLSLVLLAFSLTMALIYLLAQRLSSRKLGFYLMAATGVLFILSTCFAWSARTEAVERREAVVMSSSVSIKSSPDRAATELFVLHEGTKIEVVEQLGDWVEVRIADGRKGWIESSRVERI